MNLPAIKRFVREVVGCTCPDEVFERVDVKSGSSAVRSCSADYEINVGNRLLIVVSSDPVESFSSKRLEQVIAQGRSARDAGRFNRFRFIVRSDNAAEADEKFQRLFATLATKDERTHVHVIRKEDVPDFFGGGNCTRLRTGRTRSRTLRGGRGGR